MLAIACLVGKDRERFLHTHPYRVAMPSVAIVGASNKPERYSHQAILRYRQRGYTVWPVHPAGGTIAGLPVSRDLTTLPGRPDIVCMYVNPTAGLARLDLIVACNPQVLWLEAGHVVADGNPAEVLPAFIAEMARIGERDADADLAG